MPAKVMTLLSSMEDNNVSSLRSSMLRESQYHCHQIKEYFSVVLNSQVTLICKLNDDLFTFDNCRKLLYANDRASRWAKVYDHVLSFADIINWSWMGTQDAE